MAAMRMAKAPAIISPAGPPARDALDGHHDLKHRPRIFQGASLGSGAFRHPLRMALLPLFGFTDGVELQFPPPRSDVPVFRGGMVTFSPLSRVPFGLQGLSFSFPYRPGAGRGVGCGDGGKIRPTSTQAPPADGSIPMAQVQLGPVGQG